MKGSHWCCCSPEECAHEPQWEPHFVRCAVATCPERILFWKVIKFPFCVRIRGTGWVGILKRHICGGLLQLFSTSLLHQESKCDVTENRPVAADVQKHNREAILLICYSIRNVSCCMYPLQSVTADYSHVDIITIGAFSHFL